MRRADVLFITIIVSVSGVRLASSFFQYRDYNESSECQRQQQIPIPFQILSSK